MNWPERTRNAVGSVFAMECGLREQWPTWGPGDELRATVEARRLPPAPLVLMPFALDFYDGTGGHVGLLEAARELVDCNGLDGVEALYFLAEFLGSALVSLPESLDLWTEQYNDELTSHRTQ